ncbi:hypothetical protein THUN1379_24230 [Paludibacterium sp. THUN1379]|uniref:hypothetical protein n=1 Tax=Paludibacterium sp. THUN1379 TaxID=3112107 RepID=UPI003088D560|nr:hypothetical protein THUN1379_24230 [Paludibacterium sp. THUN1379]
MCAAIEYDQQRYYYKDSPRLPVLRRDGSLLWVQWGLPHGADIRGVPAGACARRESLLAGKWTRLKPRPVKIPCSAFMERDNKRAEHWFAIDGQLAIQGALILLDNPIQTRSNGDQHAIVYVVTEPALGGVAAIHERQPRLIPLQADMPERLSTQRT